MSEPIKFFGSNSVLSYPISYLPSYTGFGTVADSVIEYERVGGDLILRGSFTSGTSTTTEAQLSLPPGLTVRADVVVLQGAGVIITDTAGAHSWYGLYTGGDAYMNFGFQNITSAGYVIKNGDDFATAGQKFSLMNIRIPIEQWKE